MNYQKYPYQVNNLFPNFSYFKIWFCLDTIDTEQLSSQVRELLFAYSIGQRVFGEAVLNLSQGTVSEILSKPRPWHSLSVKGREPYIRMYTWYNDTGNVQKLLAWKRERDGKFFFFFNFNWNLFFVK
jgi:homeobox protein cut-like